MKTKTYAGLLSLHSHGEGQDILFLSSVSDPLADELRGICNKAVTVRYWITPKQCTRDEAQTQFLNVIEGIADVDYGARYSELTGYLWTDEDLNIGGHDLLAELKSHVGQWLILEVEIHGKST